MGGEKEEDEEDEEEEEGALLEGSILEMLLTRNISEHISSTEPSKAGAGAPRIISGQSPPSVFNWLCLFSQWGSLLVSPLL